MKKRNLEKLIIILTVLFLVSPTALASDTYSDTDGHWAETAIEEWSDYGIIQGANGAFRPDDSITRGEMATIIQRIMQYTKCAANTFADLDNTAWYAEPVLKLNAAGVMLGDGTLVRPLDTITRQEAVVMLSRALGLNAMPCSGVLPFSDSGDISSWAIAAVSTMSDYDYLDWCDGSFQPRTPITRAEVVATLDNIIEKLWRSDGLYSNVVTGNTLISGSKAYLHNSQFVGNIIIGGSTKKVIIENSIVMGNIINTCNADVVILDKNNGEIDTFYFGKYDIPVLWEVARNTMPAYCFSLEDGRMCYNGSDFDTLSGIDVSEWQKNIDWRRVANDGIDFAIIRLGYRGYTEGQLNLDIHFVNNIQGALANDIPVGVYFFSQAITEDEAVEEAQMCLDYLRSFDIEYPVVFDWETVNVSTARTNNMDGDLLTDCAVAFCETIEDAGYTPMVYSNKQLALLTYDLSRLTDYPFWFAGYTNYPEFYYGFDFWQYTSGGSVDGIDGRVDMNIQFLD